MKRKSVALALVAACSFLSVPSIAPAQDAEAQRLAASAQETHPELRKAIQDLQAARYELTRADRKFHGERGDAMEQVQYAMDQLFAAVGDKQWEDQDKQLRDQQKREGQQAWRGRKDDVAQQPLKADQPFVRMENALAKLNAAEDKLDALGPGYEGRKAKALEFIGEAKKAVDQGMQQARAQASVGADHDQAQPAAAQTGSHPELRKVIEELQAARYELSRADRKFFTERGDARQQVEFAMTQLFAAVGDKQWEEQDKQMWEKQKREGDLAPGRQDDQLTPEPGQNQPYFRMQNALKRLETARVALEKAQTTDPQHKTKALTFIREAEKAVNLGIEKAREAAKSEQI